jgi:hypothetical protein
MPRIAAAVGVFALMVFSIGFNIWRYPIVWDMITVPSDLSQPGKSSQTTAACDSSSALQSDVAVESSVSRESIAAALPVADSADDYSDGRYSDDSDERYSDKRYSDEGYSDEGPTAYDKWGDVSSSQDPYSYDDPSAEDNDREEYSQQGGYSQQDEYSQSKGTIYEESERAETSKYTHGQGRQSWEEQKSSTDYGPYGVRRGTPAPSNSGKPLVRIVRPPTEQGTSRQFGFHSGIRRLPPVDQVSSTTIDRYAPRAPEGSIPAYPSTGTE